MNEITKETGKYFALPLTATQSRPAVGFFWFVDGLLVASGVDLAQADRYGDCLTFDGGHAEHWDFWAHAGSAWLRGQGLPAAILVTEYDDHPRGRVIFDEARQGFMIYADRRLHKPSTVAQIRERFGLGGASVTVMADPHYR